MEPSTCNYIMLHCDDAQQSERYGISTCLVRKFIHAVRALQQIKSKAFLIILNIFYYLFRPSTVLLTWNEFSSIVLCNSEQFVLRFHLTVCCHAIHKAFCLFIFSKYFMTRKLLSKDRFNKRKQITLFG